MNANLIQKLRAQILAGVTSEVQVVYILAGIRKTLEQSKKFSKFKNLKFYCDWVLHSRLSQKPAQNVIRILETIYISMAKNERIVDQSDASPIVRLELFRHELSKYLKLIGLEDFTQNTNEWVVFMYLYAKAVQDCPLEMPSDTQLKIKKIALDVETAENLIDDHLPYKLIWKFEAAGDLPPAIFFVLNTYSTSKIGRI